jgi:biopolymer transport protein ExbD
MNFRDQKANGRRNEAVIDITSLVDIVFQLIIFFVLTTTFVSNPGIEVDLPRAKAQEIKHNREELVVALTKEGQIVLHGKAVDFDQLAAVFENTAATQKNTMVILQADGDVTHSRVVQIMDLAKDKGLERLAIATQMGQ